MSDPAATIAAHRGQLGLLFNGALQCNCRERFEDEAAWAALALAALAAAGYILVGPIKLGPPPEPIPYCSCQGARYDGDDGWDRDCPSHGVEARDE